LDKKKADKMKKVFFAFVLLCVAFGLFAGRNIIREKIMSYINAVPPIETTFNRNEPEQIPSDDLNAHLYMRPDSIVSITKGWIPYYHRHERDQEIDDVLLLLVKKGGFRKEYNYFFASLLSKYPQHRKALASILPSLKQSESEFIENILQLSTNYQPATFTYPVEHEKIWSEYAITGDDTIVAEYISLLTSTNPTITRVTKERIIDFLYKKSKFYIKVYRTIVAAVEFAPVDNAQLQKIASKLYDYIYEPAQHYYTIGNNHQKNRKFDKAIAAFKAGLFLAPDEPYLYRGIGHVYQFQKKYEEAIPYYQQAKWTIHSNNLGHVYSQIGWTYNRLHKVQLAHTAFKKAYKLDPDSDIILYNFANSYLKLGDIEGAALYFKELLSKKTTPKYIATAKQFFREHNIDYVITNESLQYLLIRYRFKKLDEIFTDTYNEKSQDMDGLYAIHAKMDELAPISWYGKKTYEDFLAAHLEWVNQFPASYFANATLGALYVNYAWHARGGGFASTITPEGRKLFHKRIRLAEKYLTKAYNIDPTITIAPYEMMTVAKVHPEWHDTEVETWFKRGIQADQTDYKLYKLKANYLKPKWGGSWDEQFSFARDTFKNAPVNSMAPIILAQAHWSVYDKNKDVAYFKRPEVWSELKAVYTELVKRYPESMKRHNWFAKTAYLAEDFETANAEFEIIGKHWEKSVWKTHESYDFHKKSAAQKRE
jgi:tetratricopeptide (TPR) repeat protein